MKTAQTIIKPTMPPDGEMLFLHHGHEHHGNWSFVQDETHYEDPNQSCQCRWKFSQNHAPR